MRIAYLTQPYPPMVSGASIFSEQLAREMANRGNQVLVIAASADENFHIFEDNNLTVVKLKSHNNPMRVGQRFMFFQLKKVEKTLRDFQPELIHTHDPFQIGLTGLRYAHKVNIPCIITVHQLPWFAASYLPINIRPIVEAILWVYAKWLLNQFTNVIVPTKTISSLINQKTGINPTIIGYGIDLEKFGAPRTIDTEIKLRRRFNISQGQEIILHVGRLDTDKNVNRIVLAAKDILHERDAILLIVGDGNQKNRLVQLCDQLGITDHVRFPGYIMPDQGLADIYRMASLFITASEIETQGIVLLEAAVSGLPLVAVNATCIPEIINHGLNGYLSQAGNIQSLTISMRTILDNPSLMEKMSNFNRTLATKYDLSLTFNSHEKFYRNLHFYSQEIQNQGIIKGLLSSLRDRLIKF